MTHHDGIGLSGEIGLDSGSEFDGGDQRSGGGNDPGLGGTGEVRIASDELRPLLHQKTGLLDPFIAVCPGLANDHIVRIHIVHGDALFVQGIVETGFSYHIRGAACFLTGENFRRRQRAGVKMLFADLDPQALQLLAQFPGRPLTGIGEEEKAFSVLHQPPGELDGAREKPVSVIDDSVHIHDERFFFSDPIHSGSDLTMDSDIPIEWMVI